MQNETHTAATVGAAPTDPAARLSALQAVIAALQSVPAEERRRILEAAATFLSIERVPVTGSWPERQTGPVSPASRAYPPFSDDTSMSPKQFLLEKQPRTDVERVACLAYYLTHYRDMPHFKTLDLGKLNTEAAQPKFSNAANSTNNALKRGYLVQSTKGQKQLSAAGEQFVRVLPDRGAARNAMAAIRPRRRSRRANSTKDNNGE